MYYSFLKVLGKPETQIDSSPTHVYVKTAVPSLRINENFLGSHLQEKAQRLIIKYVRRME